MSEYKKVMLRAIEAGLKGDTEALWVAKLLLTADSMCSRLRCRRRRRRNIEADAPVIHLGTVEARMCIS